MYCFSFEGVSQNTEKIQKIQEEFCLSVSEGILPFSKQKKNLDLNFYSCGQAWPKLRSEPQIMSERAGTALLTLHWGHSPGFWFSSHCGQTLPDFKDVPTGHNHSWAPAREKHNKVR